MRLNAFLKKKQLNKSRQPSKLVLTENVNSINEKGRKTELLDPLSLYIRKDYNKLTQQKRVVLNHSIAAKDPRSPSPKRLIVLQGGQSSLKMNNKTQRRIE